MLDKFKKNIDAALFAGNKKVVFYNLSNEKVVNLAAKLIESAPEFYGLLIWDVKRSAVIFKD